MAVQRVTPSQYFQLETNTPEVTWDDVLKALVIIGFFAMIFFFILRMERK